MFGWWRSGRRRAREGSEEAAPPPGSFSFENEREEPISIYFEPVPERYVLKPGETLLIPKEVRVEACVLSADGGELAVTFWTTGSFDPRIATIGGRPAASWPDEGKTSSA